ncbi:unnamed protein product [Nippostrongylus brasiliensis]|uniref:Secreted protein n=1 Tax=Nippostrongylus brasiliensis TaxID=27835 RepID=A0A0N4XD53_NIPBR|nr:unnamed protein product [Nippostrongylus brasiliensis]
MQLSMRLFAVNIIRKFYVVLEMLWCHLDEAPDEIAKASLTALVAAFCHIIFPAFRHFSPTALILWYWLCSCIIPGHPFLSTHPNLLSLLCNSIRLSARLSEL